MNENLKMKETLEAYRALIEEMRRKAKSLLLLSDYDRDLLRAYGIKIEE